MDLYLQKKILIVLRKFPFHGIKAENYRFCTVIIKDNYSDEMFDSPTTWLERKVEFFGVGHLEKREK